MVILTVLILCGPWVSAASTARVVATPAPQYMTVTLAPAYVPVVTTPTSAPQTVACQAPCECLLQSEAVVRWGEAGFSQCAELPCSYTAGNVAVIEKYCYKPKGTLGNPVSYAPVTTTPPAGSIFAPVTLDKNIVPVTATKTPVAIVTFSPATDGDTIPMAEDNCPFVANQDQKDSEPAKKVCGQAVAESAGQQQGQSCSILPTGDGIGDACDNCPLTHNKDQKDSDKDGLGDACDLCINMANPPCTGTDKSLCVDNKDGEYAEWEDMDKDGLGDRCDNCASKYNPDQMDADYGDVCHVLPVSQGGGIACDPKPDGWGDACDNCPLKYNPKQEDADKDGVGDACDNCPMVSNADQNDTNKDGKGDACDCNDGITGPFETGPDDGVLCPPIAACTYCGQYVKPIYLARSPEKTIDIVFVPSKNTWNADSWECQNYVDTYTKDEASFKKVAQDAVANWYWKMDTYSANAIPADYRHRINFYYYWRPGKTADMCGSCAGDLPDTFWTDASFADVGAILYPQRGYGKEYAGGCADKLGPDKSHFKAPGWVGYGKVILHESGHAVFSLVDTYCGDTHYEQNDPFTNVWSSETACKNELKSKGGDQTKCRQILADDPNTAKNPDCSRNFWKWDPDPDLMNDHWNGNFGPRDGGKINYIFMTYTKV
jgi:hypothetical protein